MTNLELSNLKNTVLVPQEAFETNLTLYKYREVNQRALCSLILNQVYLSRPEDFNDPFEASKEFDGALFTKQTGRRLIKREVREAGILCLCASAKNLAMWSYYGHGLRGFVIGYDLEKLIQTLEPVNPIPEERTRRWRYVFQIGYHSAHPDPVDETALVEGNFKVKAVEWRKMFASKSTTFEHENEYRIVIPPSPDHRRPFAWKGHGLYQHHPEAITQIVLGDLLPKQDEAMIRGIMAGRNVAFLRAKQVKKEFLVKLEDAG